MQPSYEEQILDLEDRYKNLTTAQLAEEAVRIANWQLLASTEFKRPRLARLARYWELYDNKTNKRLRQLFNVPIPVFAGMIDTLNAQYDAPTLLDFREGDPSDYFKVQKTKGAWQMEVMNTATNSKWDSKLRMARKHLIMNGVAIPKLTAESDPEYKSVLEVVNLRHWHFQPRGGWENENHLFNGEEDIERTQSQLLAGARSGYYDKSQVAQLLSRCNNTEYMPYDMGNTANEGLSRFKPPGLDPDNHNYVGQPVYKLAQWILELDGKRYLLVWHPWSRSWLRFERWSEQCSSDLYPWVPVASHEDDENMLSKAFSDDLYPAADAIVAMFNQELTNREKRNFNARAYDKDMFPDVRKLDEAQHRPDALVPVDTKGGSRRISDGLYSFETAELNGTVNLIDWITGSLGRNTGATDLAMGGVQEVSKKASVTFAEQKSVSKRIGWGSQPIQAMMAQLGKRYIVGLKDHMPSKMAIRLMGQNGLEWDYITRMDLNTSKDIDILIVSTDQQMQESELRKESREKALAMVDPMFINPQKRNEEILGSIGGYEEHEIAEFMDIKTYQDKKALAKAAECIQLIIRGKMPEQWYAANVAFIQKIVDYANDKRTTLGPKFDTLVDYAMSHVEIAQQNLERKITEDMLTAQTAMQDPAAMAAGPGGAPAPAQKPASQHPGMSGGMSRALSIAEQAV